MKKFSTFLCTIFLYLFLSTSQSFACSCIMLAEPEEALLNARSVFSGKVKSIETIKISKGGEEAGIQNIQSGYDVTFQLIDSFKGNKTENITIHTSQDSASCGYEFIQGEEYIVYTYGEKENESTSLCSRTKLLTDAQNDIDAFRAVTLPETENQSDSIGLEKTSTGDIITDIGIEETSTGTLSTIEHVLEKDSTLYFYIFGFLILMSGIWFMFSQKIISKKNPTETLGK